MTTYNDGIRTEQTSQPRDEPEPSSTRASRIRAFLEASSSHTTPPPSNSHFSSASNMNIPLPLLINFLPAEGDPFAAASENAANRGLPPSFLDTLDRVDKKALKKDDICPICTTPYLEDQYPLVVKLRCGHKFDLECISIWFKEHSSCPMCRQGVERRKPVVVQDDEEKYDDTFS